MKIMTVIVLIPYTPRNFALDYQEPKSTTASVMSEECHKINIRSYDNKENMKINNKNFFNGNIYKYYKTRRKKRHSSSFIGPFDMGKILKKSNKKITTNEEFDAYNSLAMIGNTENFHEYKGLSTTQSPFKNISAHFIRKITPKYDKLVLNLSTTKRTLNSLIETSTSPSFYINMTVKNNFKERKKTRKLKRKINSTAESVTTSSPYLTNTTPLFTSEINKTENIYFNKTFKNTNSASRRKNVTNASRDVNQSKTFFLNSENNIVSVNAIIRNNVDSHFKNVSLLNITSQYVQINHKKENVNVINDSDTSWPVKHAAIVEGDLILGGLMMVHSREDTVTCGKIMPQGGIQALEAMLYTLDVVNDLGLLPNFMLGAHVLDDCDKDTYGLEMAVDFIKGSISNIDDAEYTCNRTTIRKVITGVIGAASSVTSIQVANLLRLFKIPQVSFFSTSPELSNKQRFEYFTRTIPSDHYQVKAMVDIVKSLGWSYVSIIYEESNYGIKAFEELEVLLSRHNICIAVKEKLVKDSGVAGEEAYDDIIIKLLTKPRARGAIIYGSDQEVAGVMRAVERCNATGVFSWIGSDGWSSRALVSDRNERAVEGTISIQPQANEVVGFKDYFLGLTVENNKRNPWFTEFWEDHFQCRYPNSTKTPYNILYNKECTGKERLSLNSTDFEAQLQFVSDAVMAFAYAIRDMHNDVCNGQIGLCEAMKPTKGPDLLRYLRRVQFKGLTGDHFHFDINGDGPARYNILHFKQVKPGLYRWLKVGEYIEGELKLNLSDIQFKWNERRPPESVCSAECELGQAKQYVEGESCCWHCFNCTTYEIRDPNSETSCLICPQGTLPDKTKTKCIDIPEVFLRPESGWAIGAMSLSSTGILLTAFVVGVYFKYNDTPVVRASGRELSYVLLCGILMCYLVTFALVFRPTNLLCSIQRFGAGFCFTVVYAALLTKTNRISRIFNASRHSAKRPSLISPRSQLIICSLLISVQIFINGVWTILSPAYAMYHYPTREDNLLVCDSYIDASYMIAFFYPILLIVVCTAYAILTRKIPEAFNESKHIGFAMYTTCVIWLAFVPLYFGTATHVPLRITSMSVTISLSASVTLICLFSPKLYIILIRPERNVRQSIMPVKYNTASKKPIVPRGDGVMAAVMVTAVTCHQNEKFSKIQNNKPPIVKENFSQTEELEPIEIEDITKINNINGHLREHQTEMQTNCVIVEDKKLALNSLILDCKNVNKNRNILKENGIATIAATTEEIIL